ncbi:alpha/beta fold hydrolase [Falsiroseomonas sp.]|uniref:alpha/beta fold hydrolase n=1 Tax=Falsiroseomonas sp. TaxID=2870721 RepID=UPI003561BDA6
MKVTRHFLTVGNRRVHYTRCGEGPAVVLLHASPCSAKVLRLPQEVFGAHFTAFAFDTPGFGLSDLLPLERPEIEDFADGLAEALTALGVEQAATYGRHTGASIAVEFALRYPDRCPLALTDGFPVFSVKAAEERLSRYLLPIVPQWDGSHLVWLWYRYRDQHVFWPWHNQTLAFRADTDVPDAEFNHRGVVELLEAGDGYRIGYSAAFRHRGLEVLPELRVPVCFGNRPGDSQHRTMSQYPASAWQQEMPRDPLAAAVAERAVLLRHPARGTPPASPLATPLAGRSTTNYVQVGDGQVLVRVIGDVHGAPPLVIAPHVPGSSALYEDLIRALGTDIPVIAFDPPGHGESDPRGDGAQSPEVWAQALWAVCDTLGVKQAHLLGHNAGAATVVAAAAARSGSVLSLILEAPIALPERARNDWAARWAPDVAPVWDGSHLLRMWHMRRDMGLWFPWWDRTIGAARKAEPRLEPERLQEEIRELAKQPSSFAPAWQAAIAWPLPEKLARLPHRVALIASESDLFGQCLDQAVAVRPEAVVHRCGDSAAERAAAIRAALAGA